MKQYLSIIVRYFCFSLFFVLPWWWLWERNGELGTISDSLVSLPVKRAHKTWTYVCLLVGQSVNFMRESARASVGTCLTVWWRYEM